MGSAYCRSVRVLWSDLLSLHPKYENSNGEENQEETLLLGVEKAVFME